MDSEHNPILERQWIDAMREGSESAFNRLYAHYFGPLSKQAHALVNDQARAHDIVQDIFMDIWNRREELTIESSLAAYLRFAVRNAALNDIKRLKRHEAKLDDLARRMDLHARAADEYTHVKELEENFDRELDRLPNRMREVLTLSRRHGLSYVEIARKMGITKSTVKTQVNNALHVLRHKLSSFLMLLLILCFR